MSPYGKDWESMMHQYRSWLKFERSFSENTIGAYCHDLSEFRDFVSRNCDLLPLEITRSHIEQFMSEVYDRGMEASSQARILSSIRSFYRFVRISEDTEISPVEFVDTPKIARKLPDVLSLREIDDIIGNIDLSHPQGHRNKAMLEVLYSSGLRVSELVSLRLGDLFFEEGFLRVTGKGNKQRLVPMSDEAVKDLKIWMDQRRTLPCDPKCSEFVFLNRNGRKLTRVMVFTIVKQAAERAGITKTVSPHTFRHSFATHLLEGGASIRQVQELLGHESVLTTEIYTHLDKTRLSDTVTEYHPLGKQ